ncbi:netrin receptor UNC5C-like isoform X1 [Mytilus galloprovincialis]|uniref:netrin receptor UNC5C-like isoform X1 n=1 Tax=Mytilus galloprovincialis TaxID=29158 RepID=UPI003F7BDBF0
MTRITMFTLSGLILVTVVHCVIGTDLLQTALLSNAGDSRTPVFIKEPKDHYYIVKNLPIIIECRAINVVRIGYRCAGQWQLHERKRIEVDQKSGVKVVISTLEVTRDEVKEYYGGDFWCECHGYSTPKMLQEEGAIVSSRGTVEVAYLRKKFEREPISVAAELGETAVLQCLPPEGKPLPEVFWLKDGEELDKEKLTKLNYIVSHDGNLMISQTKLTDAGNYTCAARNIVIKKRTCSGCSATLTVYINGGWSSWNQWSDCSVKCGKGTKRRIRSCTNPSPFYGGSHCAGEDKQEEDCSTLCPVHGGWTLWSSWSTCSPDCLHHRRRSCENPSPSNGGGYCFGNDLDSTNCTGGMCRGRPRLPVGSSTLSDTSDSGPRRDDGMVRPVATNEAQKGNIAIYVGLCVSFAALITVVVIVVVFIRRRNRHHHGMLDGYSSGSPNSPSLSSNDEKKINKNGTDMISVQPDLTQTMVSIPYQSATPSPEPPNNNLISSVENIYDKPDINLDHRHSNSLINAGQPYAESSISNHSVSNHSSHHSADQMSDKNTMTMSAVGARPPSFSDSAMDNRNSMISLQLPSNIDMEAVVWGTFNHMGGRLVLPESGVSLTVPEGAIKKGHSEEFFLAVCRDDKDRPKLLDRQTIISPVILCGPGQPGVLKKACILSFQHCANMRLGGWMLSLCGSDTSPDEPPRWHRIVTLGQETINTSVYSQLDPTHCHIMTEQLMRYALIGESIPGGRAVKILRLAAFAATQNPSLDFSIRVYMVEDTKDALESVIQEENRYGGRLLDKPKQIPFQDGGHNLCLTIEDLPPGWRSKLAANYQEIPFQHIWSGNQNNLHCSFSLEMTERGLNKVSCKIQVYQKAILSNRQVLNIFNNFKEKPLPLQTPTSTLKGRSSTVTTNSSSGYNSMVTLDPAGNNFRLPSHIRYQLCLLLDPPNARGNDWRMLAQALTVDRYVQYFATKPSPTEHILDLWEARHREESAITDLMNIFRVMGRLDVAAVLEKDMGSWL